MLDEVLLGLLEALRLALARLGRSAVLFVDALGAARPADPSGLVGGGLGLLV